MSLTATISSSGERSRAARNTLRPMRPKPLIPTFTPMPDNLLDSNHSVRSSLWFHPITALARRGDEAMQTAGHCRAAAPGALCELCQVVVGMASAECGCLTHCGRQRLPAVRVGFEDRDRFDLPDTGCGRSTQVGCLRIQPPVHAAANLADDPPGLEGEAACLGADRAERRAHSGAGSDGDHPPAATLPDLC